MSEPLLFRVKLTQDTPCGDILDLIGGPNQVIITPYNSYNDGCYHLQPGTTVTISYPTVNADAVEVTFYRNNTRLPKPDVIGVDNDLSDGAFITWTVPAHLPPSTIYAAPLPGDFGNAVGIVVD